MSASANPLASIIVLNYNGLDHLEACLDSLSRLEFPRDRLEILLADNGSSDGSLEFVRSRYPDVSVVELAQNHGFAGGNNRAAEIARGRWVVFLNNDTRVDPRFLERLLDPLSDEVVASSSKILSFDGTKMLYRGAEANLFGFGYQLGMGEEYVPRANETPTEVFFPCGCATAFDRETFLKWGGFDEDFFAYYEDVDLGWRTWMMGGKVLYVPDSIVYHKGDGSFRHVGSGPKHVMWNRNVLFLLYKNYEPETLKKVLPLALLLTMERAFYFLDQKSESARAAVHALFAGDEESAIEDHVREVGLAHLQALDEFIVGLPALREKREFLQKSRQRSDAELARRFSLSLSFQGQVNELTSQSWQARLQPYFTVDGLVSRPDVEEELIRRLTRLEKTVLSNHESFDFLNVELKRKTEDQEEKTRVIEGLSRHIEELTLDRLELQRIRSKRWFRMIDRALKVFR